MSTAAMTHGRSLRGRQTEAETTPSPVDIERAQELLRAEDWTREATGKTRQILVAGYQCIGFPCHCQFQKGHVDCTATGRRRRRRSGDAHRLAIGKVVRQQFFLLMRYRCSSYRHNGLGKADERLPGHTLNQSLGIDPEGRRDAGFELTWRRRK